MPLGWETNTKYRVESVSLRGEIQVRDGKSLGTPPSVWNTDNIHTALFKSVLSLPISASPHCGEYLDGSERDRGKMEWHWILVICTMENKAGNKEPTFQRLWSTQGCTSVRPDSSSSIQLEVCHPCSSLDEGSPSGRANTGLLWTCDRYAHLRHIYSYHFYNMVWVYSLVIATVSIMADSN